MFTPGATRAPEDVAPSPRTYFRLREALHEWLDPFTPGHFLVGNNLKAFESEQQAQGRKHMNRMFGSRWNAALGAWVAVSEHCRARGKPARSTVTSVCAAIAMAGAGTAGAVTCTADANGSYIAGWTGGAYGVACNEVPATTGSPTV
ncbi:MAG TPA: ESPR domain-containing protein, partial [Burkholderiaceae bacterium]|nr:ESPR domain-containing protein [Burkholderiaceae bacterium]